MITEEEFLRQSGGLTRGELSAAEVAAIEAGIMQLRAQRVADEAYNAMIAARNAAAPVALTLLDYSGPYGAATQESIDAANFYQAQAAAPQTAIFQQAQAIADAAREQTVAVIEAGNLPPVIEQPTVISETVAQARAYNALRAGENIINVQVSLQQQGLDAETARDIANRAYYELQDQLQAEMRVFTQPPPVSPVTPLTPITRVFTQPPPVSPVTPLTPITSVVTQPQGLSNLALYGLGALALLLLLRR